MPAHADQCNFFVLSHGCLGFEVALLGKYPHEPGFVVWLGEWNDVCLWECYAMSVDRVVSDSMHHSSFSSSFTSCWFSRWSLILHHEIPDIFVRPLSFLKRGPDTCAWLGRRRLGMCSSTRSLDGHPSSIEPHARLCIGEGVRLGFPCVSLQFRVRGIFCMRVSIAAVS